MLVFILVILFFSQTHTENLSADQSEVLPVIISMPSGSLGGLHGVCLYFYSNLFHPTSQNMVDSELRYGIMRAWVK